MHVKQKAQPDLLERVQQWDLDALAEVYDFYAPALYRYAWHHLGDSDQAQDIVAETFQRLLIALKQGRGPRDNLQAWLYRVAHNLITDLYRRQPALDPVPVDEELPLPGPDVSETLALQRIEAERTRQALRRLTPLQQQVIILRFLEGWDLESVARFLGRETNAIKALQHRAMATLRSLLEEKEHVTQG